MTTLGRLLHGLLALEPGSPAAERRRAALELELMGLIKVGGVRAAARAVSGLKANGQPLCAVVRRGSSRKWLGSLDGGGRTLEISVSSAGGVQTTSVAYQAGRARPLVGRQRRSAQLQAAFYELYMEAGRRAYAAGPAPRLAWKERLVLLLGELEADVNNGGFAQYLENKGRRRARAALRALEAVGAARTRRMLEAALVPGATPQRLDALDARFCRVPEDLALLAMRCLDRRRPKPEKEPEHQGG